MIPICNNMSRFSERKFGIAVSNGSVALDLAFEVLGLCKDDEVILTGWRVGEIYYGGFSQYAKVSGEILDK